MPFSLSMNLVVILNGQAYSKKNILLFLSQFPHLQFLVFIYFKYIYIAKGNGSCINAEIFSICININVNELDWKHLYVKHCF